MASLIKRGKTCYAQYCRDGKSTRVSPGTRSLQIAKARVRPIESLLLYAEDVPLPTKTPLAAYVPRCVARSLICQRSPPIVAEIVC